MKEDLRFKMILWSMGAIMTERLDNEYTLEEINNKGKELYGIQWTSKHMNLIIDDGHVEKINDRYKLTDQGIFICYNSTY